VAGSAVGERIGLTGAISILLVLSALGCQRSEAARAPDAPVEVEWGGCATVRPGPLCELGGDRDLRLWTTAAEAPAWRLSTDAGPAVRKGLTRMQDGWAISVQVPAGAQRISALGHQNDVAVWSLALGTARLHPEIDELVLAGKRGDSRAAPRLRALIESGAPELRGPAEAGYGRVMLAQGEMQEAERAFRQALAADRAEGRLSDEMRDASALLWALAEIEQRFADARALLATLSVARKASPDAEAWYARDTAMLAAETNDVRAALAGYRDAFRREERLGAAERAVATAEDLARVLDSEGRPMEAVAILDRLPLPADPCARATRMINRVEMLLEPAAREGTTDARMKAELLDEQRAIQGCGDPHRKLFALFHATRYALATGDLEHADALVLRLKAAVSQPDPLEEVWRDEAVAQWSLARGRPAEALAAFVAAAAVAQASGLAEERFRAEVGAGEAQLVLGRRRAGVASLQSAQELQRRLFEGIPLGEGRGEFLSGHTEGVRHLVDALVSSGAIDQAMSVARLARAFEVGHAAKLDRVRHLAPDDRRRWDAALEQYAQIRRAIESEAKDDWKLAGAALTRARLDRGNRADDARAMLDAAFKLIVPGEPAQQQLPRLARGEAELVLFPGVNDWVAFLRTPATVVAHRFSELALQTKTSAAAVLAPFASDIRILSRVYVLPFGRADRVSWHAVPVEGRPLIARTEVVYRVDLPELDDRLPSVEGSQDALVVTNPTGDLAAARSEGDLVTRALGPSRLVRLDGPNATRDSLLRTLPTVRLFHYAGHALAEGPSGAESSLILAEGERADLGDLLALPRMPEVVFLAACEAGGAPGGHSAMGLAQAFLAAGARFVVAPQGPVHDAETHAFVSTLYRGGATRSIVDLSGAFQRAAIEAQGTSAESFRLIVR
jgi:tetratricopeptide (TPR) repeat protein